MRNPLLDKHHPKANDGHDSLAVPRTPDACAYPLPLLANDPAAGFDAQLAIAVNAIPAFVSYLDKDHRYRFVNDTYVRMFGLAREAMIGRHVQDLVGETRYRQFILPCLTRAMAGETVKIEFELPDLQGKTRSFRGEYWPDVGPDGAVRGIVVHQMDVTDHRQAEQKLREREAQLAMALDVAQMGTCEVDLATGVILWDQRHMRIFGYSPRKEPWTMADFEARIHPEDRAPVMASLEEAVRTGAPHYAREFRLSFPETGAVRWVEAMGRFVADEAGAPRRIIGVIRDITAKKRDEEGTREESLRTRTLLDRMPQLAWTTNAAGDPTYANAQCLQYTGLDITAKQNGGWANALHPDEAAHVHALWMASMATGETFEAEYRLKDREGEYRWFLGRAVPIRDETGMITEWFGTATDIHDRKAAEERRDRIQNKVTRLQAVSTAMAKAHRPAEIARIVVEQGLAAINVDAGYVSLTDEGSQCLRMLYSRGYPEDLIARFQEIRLDSKTLAADAVRTKEHVFVASRAELDARYPESLLSLSALPRATAAVFPLLVQGQALGVIGLSYFHEQEFTRERFDFLTILAEQCAQAVERARLFEAEKEARKAAEMASRAKTEFLANMSHEIRTPMNAILGFTDLLRDKSLSEQDREEFRRRIRMNGDHLLHVIDDILDLSKIESGKLETECVEFSVLKLVREAHEALSVVPSRKGVEMRLTLDGSVPDSIESDPVRLKQIITNLLGNAAKFTESGRIETRLSMTAAGDEPPMLVIDVEDTGIGIAPDLHDRLFRPFAQGDSSVTRRFGGTGLGLILSRRLAEALGGSLTLVRSAPGEGSLFRLKLPVGERKGTAAAAPPQPRPALPTKDPREGRLEGVRILMADDSFDNEALIRAYLRKTGVVLEAVRDGKEAVDKALSQPFDVILMDIQMPGMDGHEATRRLRERGHGGPIIALSAHALPEEREKSLAAGCQFHLTKPVSRNALVSAILDALDAPATRGAPRGKA